MLKHTEILVLGPNTFFNEAKKIANWNVRKEIIEIKGDQYSPPRAGRFDGVRVAIIGIPISVRIEGSFNAVVRECKKYCKMVLFWGLGHEYKTIAEQYSLPFVMGQDEFNKLVENFSTESHHQSVLYVVLSLVILCLLCFFLWFFCLYPTQSNPDVPTISSENIQTLTNNLKILECTVETLGKKISNKTEEIETLGKKISNQTEEIETLGKKISTQNEEIKNLKASIRSFSVMECFTRWVYH